MTRATQGRRTPDMDAVLLSALFSWPKVGTPVKARLNLNPYVESTPPTLKNLPLTGEHIFAGLHLYQKLVRKLEDLHPHVDLIRMGFSYNEFRRDLNLDYYVHILVPVSREKLPGVEGHVLLARLEPYKDVPTTLECDLLSCIEMEAVEMAHKIKSALRGPYGRLSAQANELIAFNQFCLDKN